MNLEIRLPLLGGVGLGLERVPIDGPCSSIDLRVQTGADPVNTKDETTVVGPNGPFRRTVFTPNAGELPVGEIRMVFAGHEVSIVGELTGRPGVKEITLEHLQAAAVDAQYLRQLRTWLQS